VKELCHIAVDQREDWSPLGHKTIESLALEDQMDRQEIDKGDGNGRALAPIPAQSERLAIIADVSSLLSRWRPQEMAAGKTSLRKIALHFHVPEYITGSAQHPGRIEIAKLGWELANH
jgi:hypothetical protein